MKELLGIRNQILFSFPYGLKSHLSHPKLDFISCKRRQVDEVVSKVPLGFKFWNIVPASLSFSPFKSGSSYQFFPEAKDQAEGMTEARTKLWFTEESLAAAGREVALLRPAEDIASISVADKLKESY